MLPGLLFLLPGGISESPAKPDQLLEKSVFPSGRGIFIDARPDEPAGGSRSLKNTVDFRKTQAVFHGKGRVREICRIQDIQIKMDIERPG